ncbi:MAG: hypothetical protein ACM3WV_00265 [Bacillota bacterium]
MGHFLRRLSRMFINPEDFLADIIAERESGNSLFILVILGFLIAAQERFDFGMRLKMDNPA